jgi:RNA polymerase sigma factor (sigma-70 family)
MMAAKKSNPVLQLIGRIVDDRRLRTLSDAELLRRFLEQGDETAFHGLVRRHGPMVLDVCHSVLRNAADAEDAFQATFMVLVSQGSCVRKAASVASWLHGVAYRTACNARRRSAIRRRGESRVAAPEATQPDDLTWREVRAVVHEELGCLAERYQSALVLCYLQGKTHAEAAAELRLPLGTLKGRLERGRAMLRSRLVRRGLGATAGVVAAAWPASTAPASVPMLLSACTVKAAGAFAAERAATVLRPELVALTREVLRAMLHTRLKVVTLVWTFTALLGVGAGLAAFPIRADPPRGAQRAERPKASEAEGEARHQKGPAFGGGVVDAGTGKPVKGLAVVVRRLVAGKPAGQLKLKADAAGRFRFELPRDWADPPDARITVSVQAPPGYVAQPYRKNYGDWEDVGVRVDELRREQALGLLPYFDRVLLLSTKQIKGRVLDPHGKPAEGVQVLACSAHLKDNKVFPPRRVVRRTKTDADGRFAAEVASPGTVVLYLLPDQYAPRLVKLTDPAANLGDYKLQAGAKVSGKLVGIKNQILPGRWVRVGEPIGDPNTDANLDLWNVGFGSLARWCRTGPAGTFETAPLAPGEYEATAHDPGQDPVAGRARAGEPLDAWFPPQKVTVPAKGAPARVILKAEPHVNVEIKVADRDGKPRDAYALSVRITHDGKNYKVANLFGDSIVLLREFDNGRRVLRVPYGASSMEVFLLPRGLSDLCDYRPDKDAAEHRGWSVFLKDLDGDRTLEYVWAQGVQASLRLSTKDGSPPPEDVELKLVQKQKSPYGVPFPLSVGGGLYRLGFVRPDVPLRIEVTAIGYKPVTREVKLPAGKPHRLEVVLEKAPQKEKGK